jgi:hypothetical protein
MPDDEVADDEVPDDEVVDDEVVDDEMAEPPARAVRRAGRRNAGVIAGRVTAVARRNAAREARWATISRAEKADSGSR